MQNLLSESLILFLTDSEHPRISCIERIAKQTDEGLTTAMVAWEKQTATDNSGNVSDVTCNPPSGTNFSIGVTTVTCGAIDGSGNTAKCSFQVTVTGLYHFL